jgi:hypothetical protein
MMENLANRIASDESGDGYMKMDEQLDVIISAIMAFNEELNKIVPQSPEEKVKLEQIKDLMENGVSPYTADIATVMDSLEVE